jgi:hypothetical protein
MRFELVEALRPSRLVFRGGGRQMTLVATLELEQAGSATRVRMKGEMEPRGLMTLLAPLMRKPIERQYATVAETFRQVAALFDSPASALLLRCQSHCSDPSSLRRVSRGGTAPWGRSSSSVA